MYRKTSAGEEYIKLRKCHKQLLNSLDVKTDLLSSLYQEGAISEDDMERINAKETSKDKADQLILMIQKQCLSGGRPYTLFLSSLEDCDQGHLSKVVESTSVKDKDWDKFKSAFLPQSGASSTTAGSPRRSFIQTMSSEQQKQIKEHINTVMPQANQLNSFPSGTMYDTNFHSTEHIQYMHPYSSNSNTPVSYDTNSDHLVTSPGYPCNSYPGNDFNIQSEVQASAVTPVTSDSAPVLTFKPKRVPKYQSSYTKSPCRKNYRIEQSINNPVNPSGQTFAWKTSNPDISSAKCRHSSGVELYQSLPSVCSLYAPVPAKKTKRIKDTRMSFNRESRMTMDSQMTEHEHHLEVREEDNEVVYNEPTDETPGVILTVADYTQSLNDITYEATHDNTCGSNGSNLCASWQRVYDSNIGTLSPTPESDAQSTDILNASRDQILANNRRQNNNECCVIL